MTEDQVIEKSVNFSETHSKDPLQKFCLQEGYVNGYTEAYNQAVDDILLKIATKEINITNPPEVLFYTFKKLKLC